MPASRSARAITLAPRSWPSSPGLATSTRIGRFILNVGRFLVRTEHTAKGIADFAERGIRAHGIEQERHGVLRAFGGLLQRVERFLYQDIITPRAQGGELLFLVLLGGVIDLQQVERLVGRSERI